MGTATSNGIVVSASAAQFVSGNASDLLFEPDLVKQFGQDTRIANVTVSDLNCPDL